ncbi:MAG: GTP cyclohydrolase I FolE [Gammaproteobacteria bacterium]|nr:GTP cyclohydrolase I FolE [Gammaproteobacteria bacterium]
MTDSLKKPDQAEAEAAVRTLLAWLGDNPDRAGLKRTPARVLNCYKEWFAGYDVDPAAILGSSFPDADGYSGMVTLTDVDFESHCEHHMAPFIGKAHVAYMPDDRVVGVSKIVKVINAFAKRLQVQEKLTKQIAECIHHELNPLGVAVVLEAQHECMSTRGVYKKDIAMVTSTMLGCFDTDTQLRDEFLRKIGRG